MLPGNPVEFTHVTLRLVPEILNAVDVIPLVGKELGMVDPKVLEVRDIQYIIARPTVGINDAVGDDFALDDRYQGSRPGVGNDLRVNPAAALQQPEYRDFPPSASASLALSSTAEIALVHFDLATDDVIGFELQAVANDLTQAMKIISGCLPVDTNQRCRASGRRARNKMLHQTSLLRTT